jgi:D-serine deaminase-like pyridoxal phosphate-dependent protein
MSWYIIDNIEELDTPALVVYPERVEANIRKAIAMVGDASRLRPHVKTHKSPEATRLMLKAGIRQFKCATIAEAEMLAAEGAPDVLLAYQPVGPKAKRLATLIDRFPGTRFSCLIDNQEAASAMAAVFATAGLDVPVYLDLNVGMDRTGIAPGPGALTLHEYASRLEGIHPVGLHVYDGHIRDTDLALRTQRCDAVFEGVLALREVTGGVIVAGGSPTFPVHARRVNGGGVVSGVKGDGAASWVEGIGLASEVEGIVAHVADMQCSPGTFVYWDKGYGDGCPEQPFEPAALVVSRVISLRSDTRLCLDLGHKSIAAENELVRRVAFINAPGLKAVGQSEEHLVVEAAPGHAWHPGDIFYGIPFHICPTVALYDHAQTVVGGRVTGEWANIARDRKITV